MKSGGQCSLIKEMLETADIIRNFDFSQTSGIAEKVKKAGHVLLSGEGSSRIFPAKSFITSVYSSGLDIRVHTEGSYQAAEYDLSKFIVFVSSNSGRTKESLTLIRKLRSAGHNDVVGITATPNTPVATEANVGFVLSCGEEKAVAATKSVVEQALIYKSLFTNIAGSSIPGLKAEAADIVASILQTDIDDNLIAKIASARMIFFAGRNNGVAEELALKTNEIVRKPSGYLEGTYALHGVEEIMSKEDVVIFIKPFKTEYEKMHEIFEEKIGATVICISEQDTQFRTIKIPELDGYNEIFELMAGWNILVNTGLKLGINLDKPARARKIGNEMN